MSGRKLVRSLLSLGDSELRQAYAADMLLTYAPALLADALDDMAEQSESFDPYAREALV